MIAARRLRHLKLITPDPARMLDYYQHVIGLTVVAQGGGLVYLATGTGQVALVLQTGPAAALDCVAMDVAPAIDLAEAAALMTAAGVTSQMMSDPSPGIAQALRLTDAEGRHVELSTTPALLDNRGPAGGIAPLKLGHVARYAADLEATARQYGALLGLRVSDWIEDRFVFLRCGHEHHALNFVRGAAPGGLHHLAFELRDAGHMHHAGDILGGQRIPILWGPVRHGPGHNVAMYHRDPDGHVVELFYGLDHMVDEELGYFDPRPWHRDRPQRPKVWTGLPRDIWGGAPAAELPEFNRLRTAPEAT